MYVCIYVYLFEYLYRTVFCGFIVFKGGGVRADYIAYFLSVLNLIEEILRIYRCKCLFTCFIINSLYCSLS